MTLLEEHLTIRTLSSAYKEHQVVLSSKMRNIGHTIGHLSADSVKTLKRSTLYDVLLTVFDDAMKLIETLRRLGIEINIAREIQFFHILKTFYDDGLTGSLPHEA